MHILHEICHVILFEAGFFPFMDRTYKIGELKPFESVEWQAKDLAGEMMMPYEETKDKSAKAIKRLCVVSGEASLLRFTNYRKDGEVNN